jgi:hypothetical protein
VIDFEVILLVRVRVVMEFKDTAFLYQLQALTADLFSEARHEDGRILLSRRERAILPEEVKSMDYTLE